MEEKPTVPASVSIEHDQKPKSGGYRWKTTLFIIAAVAFTFLPHTYFSSLVSSCIPSFTFKTLTNLERAQRLLEENPLIDGHNDLLIVLRLHYSNHINNDTFKQRFESGKLESETDQTRIREGRYGGAFWSAYYPCQSNIDDFSSEAYDPIIRGTLQQLDTFGRIAAMFPALFPLHPSGRHYTPNPDYARSDFKSGRLISPLAIEGLHQIGNSPSILRLYHALGVRYATLTWNCHNPYADAAVLTYMANQTSIRAPPLHHGISGRGRQLIREMNRLGVLVDLAHVSVETMKDALIGSSNGNNHNESWTGSLAPPFFSHSSAYAICPHPRNVPDDVLQLVKQRNSVVMVNISPGFISCAAPPKDSPSETLPTPVPENATLERVVEHIMYIGDLIGYEHVGIGTDFDGIDSTPTGMEDVSKMPDLVAELLNRGVREKDVIKVVGGNVLRVWGEAEETGKKMRAQGVDPLEDWETGFPGIGSTPFI